MSAGDQPLARMVWEMIEDPQPEPASPEPPALLKDRLAISLAEAAELVGVTERHLRNLANRGVITTVYLGARRVVPLSSLRRLLGESSE